MPLESRIPKEVLWPAARRVLTDRNYGIDCFLDHDVETVLSLCGSQYAAVPIDDVRQQIVNARKNGKSGLHVGKGGTGQSSANGLQSRLPSWYRDTYLRSDHWQRFRCYVLEFWEYSCSLCGRNENSSKILSSLDVHHRRYERQDGESVLFREGLNDVICLCRRCHKKHHKNMVPCPKKKPINELGNL